MLNIKYISILLLSMLSAPISADDLIPEIPDNIKEMAKKASNIQISPEMLERVGSVVKKIQSDEYQNQFKGMRQAATDTLELESNPHLKKLGTNASEGEVIEGDRLYVFISKSVPMETLRNYARDIAKIKNGVMVLRGFIKNGTRMAPTAKFIADILRKDPLCEGMQCELRNIEVQIDPILFKRFKITKVPAVAFEENIHFTGYCNMTPEQIFNKKNDYVVYGDTSLNYVVNHMYKETKMKGLVPVLERLKPKV